MTAFVVLHDHPLGEHAAGPEIRVTEADEAIYRADRDTGQSTAAVRSGELLSERQALEALLLPSGNNVASLLARWDAGSEAAFVDKMNVEAHKLGMSHTHYSDASGFSPATVSTARDQARLAEAAIAIQGLVQIASLRQAQLPVAGDLENLDDLLGAHGIFGLKTGSTSAAGGCFVFAARVRVGRRVVNVIEAVLGQPGVGERELLDSAFDATTNLLLSARPVLRGFRSLAGRGVLGRVRSEWADPVAARLLRVPALIGWPGLAVRVRVQPTPDSATRSASVRRSARCSYGWAGSEPGSRSWPLATCPSPRWAGGSRIRSWWHQCRRLPTLLDPPPAPYDDGQQPREREQPDDRVAERSEVKTLQPGPTRPSQPSLLDTTWPSSIVPMTRATVIDSAVTVTL